MPAQRNRKRLVKYKNGKKKRFSFVKIFIFVLVPLALIIYLLTSSKYWNGNDKVSIAIKKSDGDVLITTLDPQVEEITNLLISGDTQVELPRQLGTMKIKNVWQLGVNEDLDGKLLAETITYHLKFPVYIWADKQAAGLTSTNLYSLAKAVVLPYKTNLTVSDRLRIAGYTIRVNNANRIDLDLSRTSYLTKSTLKDGEQGYVVAGSFPRRLLVVFSDPDLSNSASTVVIKDFTNSASAANQVGEVIEVLGAKVASIVDEDGDINGAGCIVKGANERFVTIIADLFTCEAVIAELEGTFSLEISISDSFVKRF